MNVILSKRPANPKLSSKAHFLLFSKLATRHRLPHSSLPSERFAFSLENCSGIHCLKRLHACLVTSGFQDNSFLCSRLLVSYAKFGLLTKSRWAFYRIIDKDISLWHSVFVECFRGGRADEILRLYTDLRQRNIGIHGSAITFCLKSCIDLNNLEFGLSVHVDAFKLGLAAGKFVGSSLIGLYAKHGDIDEAAKVFDDITERDVVAYTSMITGYAKCGHIRAYRAFKVALSMQEEDFEPNRVTLVSLLQATSQLGILEHGQEIHGYALRRGIGCFDEVFETSLMDMYIKCGDSDKAASVFGSMSTKTVASYNALVSGHLQLEQPFEALDLLFQMMHENHKPDLIALANGLLTCACLECLAQGRSIHGYILRSGIELDLVASTALIDMYCRCNHYIYAKEVFDRTDNKDVILFNVMMAGYLQQGFASEAVKVFSMMIQKCIRPNPSSIFSILSALADLKYVWPGKSVHGYLFRHQFELHTEIVNHVIYMYAKCGLIDSARIVFDMFRHKDLVTWTSMMMGYVNHGHADEAIILFHQMQKDNQFNPDSVTLIGLLQALAQLGCLSLVKEVHCFLLRVHKGIEISIINSLITAYSNCGKLRIARNLFQHMGQRHLASWNAMISAYGMHGNCVEALRLFDQMKGDNAAPDELTFTSVLSACSHSGFVEEGLRVFRYMKEEYLMTPSDEHYACLVDLLSRSGQLEEAYTLQKCLPTRQRSSALGNLLAACRVHGNNEMGEEIGRSLLELDPINPSAYGMVSNMYAEFNKWEEVDRIRAIAKKRDLRRTPGYSLIEFRAS